MIQKHYTKQITRFVIIQILLITVCIGFIIACMVWAQFSKDYGMICGGIGITFLIGTIGLILKNYIDLRTEITFISDFANATDGIGFISCNKKTEKISHSENVHELTGIDISDDAYGMDYFHKLVNQIMSRPYSAEDSIYIQDGRDKWAKVFIYKDKKSERIILQDVSVSVYSNNLARNLSYYDSKTSLLRSSIVSQQISRLISDTQKTVCLCQIGFSAKDRKSGFVESVAVERIILSAARRLKAFEAHNIIIGHKTSHKFWILIEGNDKDFCVSVIKRIYSDMSEEAENCSIRPVCGYCFYDEDIENAEMLIEHTDFAADSADLNNINEPLEFCSESYAKFKEDYHRSEIFREIIKNNLIDYHFQPIVQAGSGGIVAYEALMRPREVRGIRLNPLEMLQIAESLGMLDEIEKLTMFNTFKFISENQDKFTDKKLFINSIPKNLLSEKDYQYILDSYGALFEKAVIEITEGSDILEEAVELLNKRYTANRAEIALDDYGTGYSNESNLIKIQPHYIKIDRSLITNINTDMQKQHLVSNMINFATQHGIKVLAEGVENFEELDTVIALGADLIQGYYTCKPMAALMLDIPKSVKNEIGEINLKRKGYIMKTFEAVENNQVIDIVNLAVNGYTEVKVKCNHIKFVGEIDNTIDMRIVFPQGTQSVAELENVNIKGLKGPAIVLEKNCDVRLEITGSNNITYEGIRVPSTSSLYFTGKGDLSVSCFHNNGVCIGGNHQQSFGKIDFGGDGNIYVFASGEAVVGIGGGCGKQDSEIKINSGFVTVKVRGIKIIGIGCMTGIFRGTASLGKINITADGQHVIGIGTINGTVDFTGSTDIKISCSGDKCCAVGTIKKSNGQMRFNDGSAEITVNAKSAIGIGSYDSDTDVIIKNGCIAVTVCGDEALGIGSAKAGGDVLIFNGIIKAIAKASNANTIYSEGGRVIIYSGNIITNDIEPITAYSPSDKKLSRYMLKDSDSFCEIVSDGENSYQYSARRSKFSPDIYMYLPENVQSDSFDTSILVSGKATRLTV